MPANQSRNLLQCLEVGETGTFRQTEEELFFPTLPNKGVS
jgi:hypothetical protein